MLLEEGLDGRPVRESRVSGVVVGHDHPPLADREEHAVVGRLALLGAGPDLLVDARVVRPVDLARRRVEQVDDRAARPEQPGGLVDDVLEQLRRVLDGHHPAGDLAQRALGVRGPPERGLRRGEPVHEPGVGDCDGGLGRERRDEPGGLLAERVHGAMGRLEDAQQALLADDGRRDDRVEADRRDALVVPPGSGGTACRACSRPTRPAVPRRSARPTSPVGGASGPSPTTSSATIRSLNGVSGGYVHSNEPDSGSMRSSRAAPRRARRAASLTIRLRMSAGSSPIAPRREAISRSARSSSARWASVSRDRPSSSISRARPSATADWPAIVSSSAASLGPNASSLVDHTVIAPNGPWSPNSGVAMTPWMPFERTYVSGPVPWTRFSSLR